MNQTANNKTPEQMVEAIFALDLDPIKLKLMDKEEGEGWTRAQADHYELEYKRFLALLAKFPDEVVAPSKQVDKFWHGHILDTMKYAEDCQDIFGYFLHHFPYFGMRGEQDAANLHDAAQNMKRLYTREFGAADTGATAYCGKAAEGTAYCGRAEAAGQTAYCGKAEPMSHTAYCGKAATDTAASAYCGKVQSGEHAYCGKAEASAYCGKARAEAQSAYCGKAETAYCGKSAPAEPSAYCGKAEPSAYCGVVAGLGRPKLEPAEAAA